MRRIPPALCALGLMVALAMLASCDGASNLVQPTDPPPHSSCSMGPVGSQHGVDAGDAGGAALSCDRRVN